ncbi:MULTISPECIES: class I SAM-dependent methyltransferase [Paenibacillus]|uniref:class I SAM-dependent methyltransferase n=1 Tax=Paenibacillus TaxID=44249 RepID=UPI0022B867CA|nr:class I SAM-dependent methyltransferase [Paenibacillus caseinilyticus]MCZ8521771.1 class I SAM-dependent methyltransferase [Paenibacillus caseinilyticus]
MVQEPNDRSFYDTAGSMNGWDFSRVRCTADAQGVDLYREAAGVLGQRSLVLDIGTGGGEALLNFADQARLAVGIDQSPAMIETAISNGARCREKPVRFLQMDAGSLHFPDGFFDMITCRHSPFSASEAQRVLAPGGVFLTQQVGERDKSNLKAFFGRGQHEGAEEGTLMRRYVQELQEAGFSRVECTESDVTETYERYEDLLFLLTHTPIIPGFGECGHDLARLDAFVEEYGTAQGIRTNASRFLIKALK